MKKKIFIIALAACLFALSIAGSSIAYFTDTEEYTNVFTAGDVNITLTYAGAEVDEGVSTNGVLKIDTRAYPGEEYEVKPYITNTGSEKAYVGAIITLTDNEDITKIVNTTAGAKDYPVAVRTFLEDLVSDGFTVKTAVSADNKVLTIYVVRTAALDEKNGSTTTCTLFNNVVIPKTWDNDEMKAFNGLELNVVAYATQTVGFDNATDALTTAFNGTAWDNFGSATVLN